MAVISGGDKLAKALAQIASKAKGNLKVGFLEGATYPESGESVASVAFWNEYGHGGNFPAPPRPFFRSMVASESGSWGPKLAALLKHTEDDGQKALAMLGEDIKGALQESIATFEGVPLSPTTLMLRKIYGNNPSAITSVTQVLDAQRRVKEGEAGATGTQAKPLVWTGHMMNSVDYEVSE